MYTNEHYGLLVNTLKTNICEVTFTKIDGTERKLRCTLIPSYLPEDFRPHNTGSLLTEGDDAHSRVSVWDLDSNEWRGFRVTSVKEFKSIGTVNPNPLVAF